MPTPPPSDGYPGAMPFLEAANPGIDRGLLGEANAIRPLMRLSNQVGQLDGAPPGHRQGIYAEALSALTVLDLARRAALAIVLDAAGRHGLMAELPADETAALRATVAELEATVKRLEAELAATPKKKGGGA